MRRSAYYSRAGSYSRSYRAEVAESSGRYPLTRAIPALRAEAAKLGLEVTVREARAALIAAHDGEWHHVGKFAQHTKYYCVDAALAAIRKDPVYAEAERRAEVAAEVARMRKRIRANLSATPPQPQRKHGWYLHRNMALRDVDWRAVSHVLRNNALHVLPPGCVRAATRVRDRRLVTAPVACR